MTSPPGGNRPWEFFETYTRDFRREDFQQVFTREAPEAYRFFVKAADEESLAALPWHKRAVLRARLLFYAFTARLSPARRAVYGLALIAAMVGILALLKSMPPHLWAPGATWLLIGFLLMNLLVLLEVADRLTLKRDLEVAREIQLAMLPREMVTGGGLEAYGFTRPANTVGGDFYDVLPMKDGRLVLALGDVAGKGSPAALLMALVLAILRTLVDEYLAPHELAQRLNVQVARHAPRSRFVTLCLAVFDPFSGDLTYVNAGQNPPLLRRADGSYERLTQGGMALGMFDLARYDSGHTTLGTGDVLIFYSDGITEAENPAGVPFDETGLQAVINTYWWENSAVLGKAILEAVIGYSVGARLADDLTVLAVRRPMPLPAAAPTA